MKKNKLIKRKKTLAVAIVVMTLIIGLGVVYAMRNVIINQIAINNYVEPFDEDQAENAQYLSYSVGEDIDPGLYTATYKYSTKLRTVSKLLGNSESTSTIGVKIYKPKLDMEFKIKMYSGSDYHNIYLEDGDTIEIYPLVDQGSNWMPNLVVQDSPVEYSSSDKLAGFYQLNGDNIAVYDDNFGSSANILYEYKAGTYRPRMFMPYVDFEDDVVASEGDIIYLESETLVSTLNS